MRILVVDDTEVNIKLMEAVLKPAGYDVITASLGAESVQTAAEEDIDLILMDIGLPDINGSEAMKKIRQTGYGNKPIIAVTAHAMQGDREKFREEGFDGYISKPINITQTLQVVEAMLRDFKSETAP